MNSSMGCFISCEDTSFTSHPVRSLVFRSIPLIIKPLLRDCPRASAVVSSRGYQFQSLPKASHSALSTKNIIPNMPLTSFWTFPPFFLVGYWTSCYIFGTSPNENQSPRDIDLPLSQFWTSLPSPALYLLLTICLILGRNFHSTYIPIRLSVCNSPEKRGGRSRVGWK